MQIGNIVKLDQKNRLHIPKSVLKAAGIEGNSKVIVNIELGEKCIKIYPLPKQNVLFKTLPKLNKEVKQITDTHNIVMLDSGLCMLKPKNKGTKKNDTHN